MTEIELKRSKQSEAGQAIGKAIIGIANLMDEKVAFTFLQALSIELDKEYYERYGKILKGEKNEEQQQ